jgi:uncharacterized protein (DUF433 family)
LDGRAGTLAGLRPEVAMNAPGELHRITVDPQVCGGRPCIRDTRVRVSDVLDLLAAGADTEEILSDYPYLQRQDIAAALQYASAQVDHVVIRAA